MTKLSTLALIIISLVSTQLKAEDSVAELYQEYGLTAPSQQIEQAPSAPTVIYNQMGNTVYDNQGNIYNRMGNTVYGNDGTWCSRMGKTVFCR
jgi:hypothetical protein